LSVALQIVVASEPLLDRSEAQSSGVRRRIRASSLESPTSPQYLRSRVPTRRIAVVLFVGGDRVL